MAIPSIIILFGSAYYLYDSYKNYKKAQILSTNISLHSQLNKLLFLVESEKTQSNTYYISKNEIPLARLNLQKSRVQLNKAINSFKRSLSSNKQDDAIKQLLNRLNKINKTRRDIDKFKNDKFEKLYDQIAKIIINYEKKAFNDISLTDIKPLINTKIILRNVINKSFEEKTIISYYLSQDIVMNEKHYDKLKTKIQINYLQLNLNNNLLDTKIVKSPKFKYILKDLYDARKSLDTTLLKYYDSGEFYGYTIDNLDWTNITNTYIKSLNKIVDNLNSKILDEVVKIQNKETTILLGAFAIFIFAIFILSINIMLAIWTNKRVEKFSKLMKSIADVTNNKKEIELLTEKGQEEAFDTVDEAIEQVKNDRIEAQSANRAKSLFLANMSHEIRTPLNGVLGFVTLLKESKLTAEQNEYLNIVQTSAQVLLEVINNILDISKLESGKMELYNTETNLTLVAKNTIKLFKAKANEKEIELGAYIDPNLPLEVMADSLKIKDIISNLIGNAIKFTNNNGHININIRLKKIENKIATIYVEVVDDGIGISHDKQEKVFQSFEQAEQSTTKHYGGTGLGITIVNSYLELMDSKLELESKLGEGSKFFFEVNFDLKRYTKRRVNKKYCNINMAYYSPEHTLLNPTLKEYLNFYQVNISKASRMSSLEKMLDENILSAVIVECKFLDDELIKFLNKNNIESLVYSKTDDIKYLKQKLTSKTKFLYMPIFICDIEKILASISGTSISCGKDIVKISDLRVMIVEDDKINQNVLKAVFNKLSIDVKLINNGKDALKEYVINYNKYDIIFMDLRMPELDGIEATQFILNYEEKNNLMHTPIIALTADISPENKNDFLNAGADDFLTKPIKQTELIKSINKIINEEI